eukprot:2654681-Prymnesium_polylepis.1
MAARRSDQKITGWRHTRAMRELPADRAKPKRGRGVASGEGGGAGRHGGRRVRGRCACSSASQRSADYPPRSYSPLRHLSVKCGIPFTASFPSTE